MLEARRASQQISTAASNSLPAAQSAPDHVMQVEVDAGWLGLVRLTFEKHKYHRPKGKFSAASWSCKHVELIAPAESPACERPN